MPSDTPVSDLPERFREHLRLEKLFPKGGGVVVGVSGRSESVALLHLLHDTAAELDLRLTVVHVRHGENPDAAADAAFVRELAGTLRLPFDVFANEEQKPDSSGRAADHARHFARVQSRFRATAVATAETADDLAEEFLERMVEGRTDPLQDSLRPARSFVRPLLPFTREECREFLTERRLTFRADQNALSPQTTRKKLRLFVLPMLRRHVQRSALENLATASRLLAEDHAVLQALAEAARAEAVWTQYDDHVSLDHRRWAALPAALRRRLLADAVKISSAPLSWSELLDLDARCRLLRPDTPMTVGKLNIVLARGMLTFVNFERQLDVRVAGEKA